MPSRLDCDILNYEDDEGEIPGKASPKKPWRYRWRDNARDEVLARLLELNAKQAEKENVAGAVAPARLQPSLAVRR